MLPKEAITEFKDLYLAKFGEDLSYSEAARKAEKFMDLYRAGLGPQKPHQSKENVIYEPRNESN